MIRALHGFTAAFLLLTTGSLHAEESGGAFAKAPVADSALATMRGGFALPGGLDVSIAVRSDTALNGVEILRTLFRADRGPASLSVLANGGSANGLSTVAVQPGRSVATAAGPVSVSADGTRVTLSAGGLDITHLAGSAYGSFAANRLDNVSVATATTVDITLRNATALNLGSALGRVDSLAGAAAASLAR